MAIAALDVNVRGLVSFIAEEKEAEFLRTQDGRHVPVSEEVLIRLLEIAVGDG